jgi:hypothetical protein
MLVLVRVRAEGKGRKIMGARQFQIKAVKGRKNKR